MNPLPGRRQPGFSLVELMVALVISLLLLAGILQIVLSNRASFSKQQTLAGLQENARLAHFVIQNVVAQAGYRVQLLSSDDVIFPALTDITYGMSIAQGAFVAGTHPGGTQNDALRVRFQASGGVHDCLGNTVGGPTDTDVAIGDFALAVDPTAHSLQCIIYNADGSIAAQSPQPLIDNVDRFKVRYGLDTNNDNSVDTYTSSLSTNTAKQVRSLRLQLLLETDVNVLPRSIQHSYTFADGTTATFDDRRARELVDQTVALRNVLP